MRKISLVLLFISIACILLTPSPSSAEYNPTTGRFLQRDPVKYEDSMSLYQYVVSNPIMFSDEYGLQAPISYFSFYSIPKKCHNDKCGPDVTDALAKLRKNMIVWFFPDPDPKKRNTANIKIDDATKRTLCEGRQDLTGWDIPDLKEYKDKRWRGKIVTPRKTNHRIAGCATGDCKDTVQVGVNCYSADEVNYFAYGVMTKICAQFFNEKIKAHPEGEIGYFYNIYTGQMSPYRIGPHRQSKQWNEDIVNIYTWSYHFQDGNDKHCKMNWFKAGYSGNLTDSNYSSCGIRHDCEKCGKTYPYTFPYVWWRLKTGKDSHVGYNIYWNKVEWDDKHWPLRRFD